MSSFLALRKENIDIVMAKNGNDGHQKAADINYSIYLCFYIEEKNFEQNNRTRIPSYKCTLKINKKTHDLTGLQFLGHRKHIVFPSI